MPRAVVILLLQMFLISCNNSSKPEVGTSSDEMEIRQTRDLFNLAIAKHDTLHIGDSWMDNFSLITSTNLYVEERMRMSTPLVNTLKKDQTSFM